MEGRSIQCSSPSSTELKDSHEREFSRRKECYFIAISILRTTDTYPHPQPIVLPRFLLSFIPYIRVLFIAWTSLKRTSDRFRRDTPVWLFLRNYLTEIHVYYTRFLQRSWVSKSRLLVTKVLFFFLSFFPRISNTRDPHSENLMKVSLSMYGASCNKRL